MAVEDFEESDYRLADLASYLDKSAAAVREYSVRNVPCFTRHWASVLMFLFCSQVREILWSTSGDLLGHFFRRISCALGQSVIKVLINGSTNVSG
jgi:hypothetical protein